MWPAGDSSQFMQPVIVNRFPTPELGNSPDKMLYDVTFTHRFWHGKQMMFLTYHNYSLLFHKCNLCNLCGLKKNAL